MGTDRVAEGDAEPMQIGAVNASRQRRVRTVLVLERHCHGEGTMGVRTVLTGASEQFEASGVEAEHTLQAELFQDFGHQPISQHIFLSVDRLKVRSFG